MRYRRNYITHFAYSHNDIMLFLGRPSLFNGSKPFLPNLRKITVDISSADARILVHGRHDFMVSTFVTELVGMQQRADSTYLEVRVLCEPETSESVQSKIEDYHLLLASNISTEVKRVLGSVQGIDLVVSFQGPLRSQTARNRRLIRSWARENGIRLLHAPVRQGSFSGKDDDGSIARNIRSAQDRWSLY